MTGDKKYLDFAHRLADYYLLPGKFMPTRLSDHGCEIIGGLGLLFAIDVEAAPETCQQYKPHLEQLKAWLRNNVKAQYFPRLNPAYDADLDQRGPMVNLWSDHP